MKNYNPNNERIKRKYFIFTKEAKRQNEATIDAIAKAMNRFEVYTKFRDFKAFHYEQAIAFKKHLSEQKNQQTGKNLSKATLSTTLGHIKRFFQWLSEQPGYKSRISYSEAEYFNLSEKDARIATAHRTKPVPTLDQIKHVIDSMSGDSDITQRNRAIIAFTILTGARDSAIASLKLKHIDFTSGYVFQDAREVRTKFSKTFNTYFFPVGDEIRQIVEVWVTHLIEDLLFSHDDPMFPSTQVSVGENQLFEAVGITREHWSNSSPIRKIFKDAFTNAGLPYFNPHSFRNTLSMFGQSVCKTPEDFKAWSQNLGHDDVMTTFISYGEVPNQRQAEIIHGMGSIPTQTNHPDIELLANAIARELRNSSC